MSANLEIKTRDRSDIDEALWNDFIVASPQGANYAMTWYLDIIWPGWQGIHIFYKKQLYAVMPLRVASKFSIRYALQPMLSQYQGIFFKKMQGRTEKVLALKKKLVQAAVDAVQKKRLRQFVIHFAPEFDYPLPFHWAGFKLQARYSYWLDNQADKQAIFKNFNERTRTYINKANRSGLMAKEVDSIDELIQLSRQNDSYLIDYQLLKKIWLALRQKKVGRALEVRDEKGTLHAGLVYQISGRKQIHLFSAKNPTLANFGGMSLAIWESIRQAGEEILVHDFEGSMLQPVEHFFRGFGPHPVPYLRISKNNFPRPIQWWFDS
ncbi:MAG: hypothetical protein AAFZ15_24235 [Bacteroidota bacterium]